jgi:hypothetical protein
MINDMSINKEISSYLSKIGRKGGQKSKRKLSPETAQLMVREAKRAFKKYYTQCFWSYDPKMKITANDVKWVGRELLKNGGMSVWKLGNKLCQ